MPPVIDFTTSLGNLCQFLITCTLNKCFLIFRGNLPCFSLCPLPLVLVLCITEKSLALCMLPSGIYRHWWDQPELLLPQPEQTQPSWSFVTGAPYRFSSSFIIFIALCWIFSTLSMSLVLQNRCVLSSAEQRGKYHVLSMHARIPLALSVVRAHY